MGLTEDELDAMWRELAQTSHLLTKVAFETCRKNKSSSIDILTTNQLRVMSMLQESFPNPVRLKDLADKLKLTPASVSMTVDVLFNLGHISRTTDAHDRRAISIVLSARGKKMFLQSMAAMKACIGANVTGIPEDDLRTFLRVLQAIHLNINTSTTAVAASGPGCN